MRTRATRNPDVTAHGRGSEKTLRLGTSLADLAREFPAEWERVQDEVASIIQNGRPEDLKALLERPSPPLPRARPGTANTADAVLSRRVEQQMARLLIKSYSLSVATGVTRGKIRFNWVNGFCAQRLLFSHGFERKPASLFWFRLIWPLLWQRNLLMPLASTKGIYCFYSRELVDQLAALIGGRRCLEIGAGDGTLTRFLKASGTRITATDDHSWKHVIAYPPEVVKCDARAALERFAPEVVVCSWPPAGNAFERYVFRTRSVQLYVVIGSRLRLASGNWDDYRNQSRFVMQEDPSLSRLVLPPELGSAVYVFRRTQSGPAR